MAKAKAALEAHLSADQAAEIMRLAANPAEMDAMPLSAWLGLFSA